MCRSWGTVRGSTTGAKDYQTGGLSPSPTEPVRFVLRRHTTLDSPSRTCPFPGRWRVWVKYVRKRYSPSPGPWSVRGVGRVTILPILVPIRVGQLRPEGGPLHQDRHL